MANEKKIIKRIIGGSLITIAGVTLFYQWRFSQVQESSKEYIVVATRQINPHEELTDENVKLIPRRKEDVVSGNITDINAIFGSIAKEVIYKNEDINQNRLMSKEEYEKLDYRLISIKVSGNNQDALVGFDVKPFDKVDLLFYDKEGVYEGKPYLIGEVVYDLKSKDGISYADRGDSFIAAYALMWVKKDIAEDIYEKQEQGGYFKFQLHRDRAVEETNILKEKLGG